MSSQSEQDAILLLTWAMQRGAAVSSSPVPAVALAALSLSYGGADTLPAAATSAAAAARGLAPAQVEAAKTLLTDAMHGNVRVVSALRVVYLYQERLMEHLYPGTPINQLPLYLQLLYQVACLAGRAASCTLIAPTLLAAAAFVVVRRFLGMVPVWP